MFDDKIEALNATPIEVPPTTACEKMTYTVNEIQDILGISLPSAYALIKKNEFRSVNIGRHIRVSKPSFDAWLNGQ